MPLQLEKDAAWAPKDEWFAAATITAILPDYIFLWITKACWALLGRLSLSHNLPAPTSRRAQQLFRNPPSVKLRPFLLCRRCL